MKLTKDLGLMLYWGEGDKTGNYFVALTNTNPEILKYFITWLRKYFEINEQKLKCRLYLWSSIDEDNAKLFWSKKLNIPLNQFTKTYLSKSKPKVRKVKHVNGVCRVSYGSTKIFGQIVSEINKKFC